MQNLTITYVDINSIKEYKNHPKLHNRAQVALATNSNHKSPTRRSPNLLSGKLHYHTGARFINQRTCGKAKADKYYYATKGFYILAPPVDEIVMKTVADFLDSDMSAPPVTVVNNLKQICFDNLAYARCKELARTMIHKVVYSQNKLIIYIDTTADIKGFTSDTFNQNANPMDFVVDGGFVVINIPIMLSRYTSKIKPGTLTITDNNHLILKAFATAWKYREMYEQCGDVDTVAKEAGSTPRTIYRFLDIAYMNPTKVNEILSGKPSVNINALFNIAKNSIL